VGQAVHVIGFREPPAGLRTLKIERIERIELTAEKYQIPDDFHPEELLKYAWGIWYTEEEPYEVVLKFSPRVVRRVGETRWHRTEQVTPQEDGSLLWQAWIAEPLEMLPWIRGWGADCEVVAPQKLRNELAMEAEKLKRVYG
jgi:predicted DNA-binding transcriptional regulator YafY